MSAALTRAHSKPPLSLEKLPKLSLTGLVVAALLGLLAYPTILQLTRSWQHHPDYEHGWLLLPVTIWLFLRAKPWAYGNLPQIALGKTTLLAGGLFHLTAQVITWPLLDYAAWFLIIRGVVLASWGRVAGTRIVPALLFSFFLFPLPLVWLNDLALWLQNLVSYLASFILSIFWVCHRQGNFISVAGLDQPLSIAAECSGVRQLMVFLSLSCLLSIFLRGSLWRKALLIFGSIAVAIAANVFRVVLLACLARWCGTEWIQGTVHDMPLLLTLPLGAMLLWIGYINLQIPLEDSPLNARDDCSGKHHRAPWASHLPGLVLLVFLQLGLQAHLQSAQRSQPLLDSLTLEPLPWKLGSWVGADHPEAARVAQQASFADVTLTRAYVDSTGRTLALYIVYSKTGRDREHHPEICLRDAGGATEIGEDRRQVQLQPQTTRIAQRFRYRRDQLHRTTVYYWHYTILPQNFSEQTTLQRIYLRQRENMPSLTVQVQTNMPDPAAWQAIETTFLPELDRWLQQHLPVTAKVGIDRLPIRFMVTSDK